MKKICIITQQSVICNNYTSGIGETADGLAISLSDNYEVYVITAAKNPDFLFNFTKKVKKETKNWISAKVLKVKYFILKENFDNLNQLLSLIHPDLIQLIDFELDNLPNNVLIIYTIDEHTPVNNYTEKIVLSSDYEDVYNCKGLDTGILMEFFNPGNGLFIPKKYNINDFSGKDECKKRLCARYSLDYEKPLYVYLGRLFWKKGIEYFSDLANEITSQNGQFVVCGKIEEGFENNNIIHINEKLSAIDSLNWLAAADFYVACSKEDVGPLMPRHAACYGAIPITTNIRGMRVIFNDENSIVYTNAKETINECMKLYNDKDLLKEKRIVCMTWDFSWKNKIQNWINFYNFILNENNLKEE